MELITGENIVLRRMTYDDTDRIIAWRNQESVRKNFIYQADFTKESHENWIRNYVEPGKAVQMIILEKESGCPIGSVYLRDIDYDNRKAEYGIFIGEETARGKGYGTEAAKLMVRYAFDELKLHKVFLRVLKENIGAQKSYEKAGFRKEAELVDEVKIHGEFRTEIFMAQIKVGE